MVIITDEDVIKMKMVDDCDVINIVVDGMMMIPMATGLFDWTIFRKAFFNPPFIGVSNVDFLINQSSDMVHSRYQGLISISSMVNRGKLIDIGSGCWTTPTDIA